MDDRTTEIPSGASGSRDPLAPASVYNMTACATHGHAAQSLVSILPPHAESY